MFSRREDHCCITAIRRSSNAPLNPPAASCAASSNSRPLSLALTHRFPRGSKKKEWTKPLASSTLILRITRVGDALEENPQPGGRLAAVAAGDRSTAGAGARDATRE